ncbi:uncharacterized protein [Rutidosis leptorrhynchoides]|uniref:uncharacterized protein n=1 Tax=Rutidosis leptorrhynchoides TaxID=125765 RepID=UPI003A994788
MKLNPLKCSFGETEGKFLGYPVTEQGIQANPKKIGAIENITAPKTVKELVANQFSGSFEAHDPFMQKYLQLLKETAARFEYFELAQVPRSQNKKADALRKLAALTFLHFQKQVWVEELTSKSIESDLMVASVTEEQPNWMEPILKYIRSNILPEDSHEARSVRERVPMYIIQDDILYHKSYCAPMMRCVGPIEAEMIVEEVWYSARIG